MKIFLKIIFIVLLVVIAIEGILFSYVSLKRIKGGEYRTRADAYGDKSWVNEYYDAYGRVGTKWHPYVYWRRRKYKSSYINVDKEGIRRTWNKNAEDNTKVFMFGGSAMWGKGARDDHTIASYLSKLLNSERVKIVNYGEIGYVSTQEVITLMHQLQNGNVPDVVIFYDGINDVLAAHESGEAGVTFHEKNRAAEFNLLNVSRRKDLRRQVFLSFFNNSSIYRAFKKLRKIMGIKKSAGKPADPKEVVNIYASNIKLVETLGKSYGFKSFFFWQPTVFDKSFLSSYEEERLRERQYLQDYWLQVTKEVIRSDLPGKDNFYDLSNLFAKSKKPYFIDFCHLAEEGNNIIAKQMHKNLKKILGDMI